MPKLYLPMNRMMNKTTALLILFLLLFPFCSSLRATSIVLHSRDAVAWLPQQTMRGSMVGFRTKSILIHQDNKTFSVAINDTDFQFSFILHDGINAIWVEGKNGEEKIASDTVWLTLGYHPEPLILPYAELSQQAISLHAKVIMNPWQKLNYHWTSSEKNKTPLLIQHPKDSTAQAVIPKKEGVYYFDLQITSGKDTARFETFVVRRKDSLQAFDMNIMHAPWIDSAIIYEITPHAFVANTTYDDITAKLSEIKSLGVNTIWLQPLMKNIDNAQGYEVTDYFSLRDDLGSEAQLQHLITTAKALGLRILFDFVPNHTSMHHPYAQEVKAYRENSHYYNFYQHANDGAMYSSHYHTDSSGFVYYFWDDLVNLNYSNPEVQQWIIEACKYWVKKYNIDGYRFDAVWGVNARQPDFGKKLQMELKSIKPDLFFLAEDKAFGGALQKGFDAVYDWTADTGWVSQWSWQYEYHPEKTLTVFNHLDKSKRDSFLRHILFDKKTYDGLRLHFLENNDVPRFTATHSLEQTKTAAVLMFTLPGIPMIYNGQEVGIKTFPRKKKPTFIANQTVQSLDSNRLFSFYQNLVALRKAHHCLLSNKMEEIKASSSTSTIAFKRWDKKETMITVMNLDSTAITASLNLQNSISKQRTSFTLTDMMTKERLTFDMKDMLQATVPMKGQQARILLLSQED